MGRIGQRIYYKYNTWQVVDGRFVSNIIQGKEYTSTVLFSFEILLEDKYNTG